MRISRLVLLASLAITGCSQPASDSGSAAAGDSVAETPAPAPSAAAKALPAEQPGEIAQSELLGIWRVTGVVPDQGAKFVADDKAILGSLIDIAPEQLRWSYAASTGFDSDDMCFGPVAGIIDDPAYAATVRGQMAPALVRAGESVTRLSPPHQWLCGDGGDWGGGAAFQRLADDQLAMRWTGGVTLLLTRLRKLPAKAPELPPTGAYEAGEAPAAQ